MVDTVIAQSSDVESIEPKECYGNDPTLKARCERALLSSETIAYTIMDEFGPMAILAGYFVMPGVFELWSLLDRRVVKYPVTLVKQCRTLLDSIVEKHPEIRRIQAYAPNDGSDLANWFNHLGLYAEARLRKYMSEDVDAILYVRIY